MKDAQVSLCMLVVPSICVAHEEERVDVCGELERKGGAREWMVCGLNISSRREWVLLHFFGRTIETLANKSIARRRRVAPPIISH